MKIQLKLMGIGVTLLLLCLIMTACGEPPEKHVKTLSGTVTAGENGSIVFRTLNGIGSMNISFTTDLPEPNNEFEIKYENVFYESSLKSKSISNLTPGQKVKWTATSSYYFIEQKTTDNIVEIQSYVVIYY